MVPSSPNGKGAAIRVAPRRSMAEAVSLRKGCASTIRVPRPIAGISPDRRAGSVRDGLDPHRADQPDELVLHDVRKRPDDDQRRRVGRRQDRHHRGEAGVFAFRERGLDARAGIVQHPNPRRIPLGQTLGRAGEVELDDLRRARSDQEQLAHVRPALEHPGHLAVELVVGIGEPREVLFLQDRRPEPRLAEDHHPGGRLQEVRAGARAHHQEKGVLHLAVQPDDPGQPAEHLALATLLEDRRVAAAGSCGDVHALVHAGTLACRRAARSLSRNCPALIT